MYIIKSAPAIPSKEHNLQINMDSKIDDEVSRKLGLPRRSCIVKQLIPLSIRFNYVDVSGVIIELGKGKSPISF